MPRNKRHVNQEEKKQDIIAAASRLFADKGFDGTSMTALAKEAGITANTIYWYFKDKDDVLIAVLNDVLQDGMAQALAMRERPTVERILALIELVEAPGSLMNTVHSRVQHSETVSVWHGRFHQALEQMLVFEMVSKGVEQAKCLNYARLLVYIIEGLISHPHQVSDREIMIKEALALIGFE